MYSKKMAVAIKVGGKVLRENAEQVSLPFGSEYSILVKNLSTVRAIIKISIDGTSITDNSEIIVMPNSSVDLERFIKNGNMSLGNKLKFIERTDKISNHRGNKIDDGLVRVEYRFEKIVQFKPKQFRNTIFTKGIQYGDYNVSDIFCDTDSAGPSTFGSRSAPDSYSSYSNEVSIGIASAQTINNTGITVEGSESKQQFTVGKYFETEVETHAIVIKLVGEVEGEKLKAPILAKAKPRCKTCGHLNKSSSKFCTECGTCLTII